jgi:hypothetical protein
VRRNRKRAIVAISLSVVALVAMSGVAAAATPQQYRFWQSWGWARYITENVAARHRIPTPAPKTTTPAPRTTTPAAPVVKTTTPVTTVPVPVAAGPTTAPTTTTTTAPATATTTAPTTVPAAGGSTETIGGTGAADQIFAPNSFWYSKIPATAPLAPNSAAMAADVASQAANNYGGAAFNAHQFNAPVYEVAAGTPTVNVGFWDCQGKGSTPNGILEQFSNVPIPADAAPAEGTDAELAVHSASLDKVWEFWQMRKVGNGWQACWGGRIDNASKNPGIFANGFGATATGLPANLAGAITFDDISRGSINHALALQLVNPKGPGFSWPAQRTDGSNNSANAVAEGQRLRLDPTLNVDSLGLNKVATMVAKAAQTYGFIVTDRSGAVSIMGQDSTPKEEAAGVSWDKILNGLPDYQVFRSFPWSKVQVLPMDFGK